MKNPYDKDYFENGVAKQISGYTNYSWKPEYFLPLADELKKHFLFGPSYQVLDYGTAKGFMVKAFRLLNVQAYGYDISEYAIENADPAAKPFVTSDAATLHNDYNLIVAKDVLEHVPEEELPGVLNFFSRRLHPSEGVVFVVVPLGDNGVFRIREYELDKTHVIKEDEQWWMEQFIAAGFIVEEFMYHFPGAKDHWQKINPYGNASFVLRRP